VPNPELAVIQFYALTVYPHVVRSMFGISLDPQATEELLTSGVNTFLCYYRPAARSKQPPRTASHRSGKREGTMTYPTDPRVDAYIDAVPAWHQAIYRQVGGLVYAADPEVTETINRTTTPTSCWTATSAPCRQPRAMSTSSPTTAPSSPTPRPPSRSMKNGG